MTTQATANYTLTATDETAKAFNSVENRLKGVQEETKKIGHAASLGFKLFVGGELMEGLRKLGAAMFDVKNATNSIDAGRIQRMREATDQAGKAFAGVAATLGSVLAPMIQHLSEWFVKAVGDGEGLRRFFHALMVGMVRGVGLFADAWRGMEAVWAGLKVVFAGFNAFIFDGMEKADRGVTDLLNKLPGVKVEYSSMWAGMAKDARDRLAETRKDFDDIMGRPIPSDAFASAIADMDKETAPMKAIADKRIAAKKEANAADKVVQEEHQLEMSESRITWDEKEAEEEAKKKEDAHNARIQDLGDLAWMEKAKWQLEQNSTKARINGVQQILGAAAGLMQSTRRKEFEVGKAAAIANATVSMFEGIGKAFSYGPILGPIFAALVAASGMMNIRQIKSQQFNGGGAANVGATPTMSVGATGIAKPSSAVREAPSIPLASNASAPARNVTVMVQSDTGVVSTSWIRDHLIPGINEAVGDGVKIMVA